MECIEKFEALVGDCYFPYRIEELTDRRDFVASVNTLPLIKCSVSDAFASVGFRGRFVDTGRGGNLVFHFIKSGELEIVDGIRTTDVKEGELVIFSDSHCVRTRQIGAARALAVNIPEDAIIMSDKCISQVINKPISFLKGTGAILFSIINSVSMQREFIDQSMGAMADRAIVDFITALLFEVSDDDLRASNTDERHYARIMDCICKNIDQRDLSIDFVSARLGMSRSYLCTILSVHGKRFERIVMEARLDRARSMLNHGSRLCIAQVAERAGFSSASHFSRSFSQAFGVPPLAYRKRNLN